MKLLYKLGMMKATKESRVLSSYAVYQCPFCSTEVLAIVSNVLSGKTTRLLTVNPTNRIQGFLDKLDGDKDELKKFLKDAK